MPADAEALWDRYFAERTEEARAAVFEHYLPLVRNQARRLTAYLPPSVGLDDLAQEGSIALWDLIATYEPRRGSFEAYLKPRLTGQMRDHLRTHDWLPRTLRSVIKTVSVAAEELASTHKQAPNASEIAVATGLSEDAVREAQRAADMSMMVNLDDILGRGSDPASADRADESTDVRDLHTAVWEIIPTLRLNQRTLILLYVVERLELQEIARVLNVTPPRVTAIRRAAYRALTDALRDRGFDIKTSTESVPAESRPESRAVPGR